MDINSLTLRELKTLRKKLAANFSKDLKKKIIERIMELQEAHRNRVAMESTSRMIKFLAKVTK